MGQEAFDSGSYRDYISLGLLADHDSEAYRYAQEIRAKLNAGRAVTNIEMGQLTAAVYADALGVGEKWSGESREEPDDFIWDGTFNAEDVVELHTTRTSTGERARTRQNTVDSLYEYGIMDTDSLQLSSHNMHNSSDELFERSKHVLPVSGYDDVFIHGNQWGVSVKDADGNDIDIPAEEFIKTLKSLKLENDSIRLCACEAGLLDDGFASFVARAINKPVMAPTTLVWIGFPDNDGISEMELYEKDKRGRKNLNKPGRWRVFNPDGSIEEYEK